MAQSQQISYADVLALLAALPAGKFKTYVLDLFGPRGIKFDEYFAIEGDVEADTWSMDREFLIVTGSIRAGSHITDANRVDHTNLIVLGDLVCEDLFTYDCIAVAGNIIVENLIYADSSGNAALLAGGSLGASMLIDNGHSWGIEGGIQGSPLVFGRFNCGDHSDYEGSIRLAHSHEHLVDDVLEFEAGWDEPDDAEERDDYVTINGKEVFEAIINGRSIARSEKRSPLER